MTITAEAVKQLRERTGAGMMECKRALVETSGDLDAAAELMRKQGLAKADKKAARIAAEGVIAIAAASDRSRGRHGRGELRDRFRGARARFSRFRPRGRRSRARPRPRLARGAAGAAAARARAAWMKRGARWSRRSARTSAFGAIAVLESSRPARRVCARHAHRRAGRQSKARMSARPRSCDACRGEQSAVSDPRASCPRDHRQGARGAHRAGACRRQATRDRRQDGGRAAAQSAQRDHSHRPAFCQGSGCLHREAAEGRLRQGQHVSSASRSERASRSARRTSSPRSWRR